MNSPVLPEDIESMVAMTPQQRKLTSGSGLGTYREMSVGGASLPYWLTYELLTFGFSWIPGLAGFGARSLLYPMLFGGCGKRPAIGASVLLRNPRRIFLGDRVLVDDLCSLDVRGDDAAIRCGDRVSIGRLSTIVAKHGEVNLGNGVNIGSYCRLATQSKLTVEESVLIAAYCYIGPGNHQHGDSDTPLIEREMEIRGGVHIGAHSWIGAKATILDGVTIGRRAIVGAHSLVRENVPDGAIVVGSPARVIGQNNAVS